MSRVIGSFQGRRGNEYVLEVESLRDGSALAPAKPRIVVRVHPLSAKSYLVAGQGLLWIGLIATISALLSLARSRIRLRRA